MLFCQYCPFGLWAEIIIGQDHIYASKKMDQNCRHARLGHVHHHIPSPIVPSVIELQNGVIVSSIETTNHLDQGTAHHCKTWNRKCDHLEFGKMSIQFLFIIPETGNEITFYEEIVLGARNTSIPHHHCHMFRFRSCSKKLFKLQINFIFLKNYLAKWKFRTTRELSICPGP